MMQTPQPELPFDEWMKLVFDRPMNVEVAAIRNALPSDIGLAALDAGKEALSLTLSLPKDWQVRSFDDETGLVVDLLRPVKQESLTLADLNKLAAQPAAFQNKIERSLGGWYVSGCQPRKAGISAPAFACRSNCCF